MSRRKEEKHIRFRFIYDDGSTRDVDIPATDLGRSGDDTDVRIYMAKNCAEDGTDVPVPTRIVRVGPVVDR